MVARGLHARGLNALLLRAAAKIAPRGLGLRPTARAFSTARASYAELRGPPHYPLIGGLPFFQKHGGAEGMFGFNRALYAYGNLVTFSIFGDETLVVFDPSEFLKIHRAAGKTPSGGTNDLCGRVAPPPFSRRV